MLHSVYLHYLRYINLSFEILASVVKISEGNIMMRTKLKFSGTKM